MREFFSKLQDLRKWML